MFSRGLIVAAASSLLVWDAAKSAAFAPLSTSICPKRLPMTERTCSRILLSTTTLDSLQTISRRTISRRRPRKGILQFLLDLVLASPLWKYVLVPQARKKMEATAQANGIPWAKCRAWLQSMDGPWNHELEYDESSIPEYYKRGIHAYDKGNLCWEAALEVEIASRAVGARAFPQFQALGEKAFRDSFQVALEEGGATFPREGGVVVDLGCGTGVSTRRLAKEFPKAKEIIGIDLSPYYCLVGDFLLKVVAPVKALESGGPWVNSIEKDNRIQFRVGNAAQTGLPNNSVDVVNLQFVAHELPYTVTLDVLREAHRILKDNGGQLWFSDFDFETPSCTKHQANPLLFSLLRSTEPFLDDYAYHAVEIRTCLQQLFAETVIVPATGRHFAIVATKNTKLSAKEHFLRDTRFDENGVYRVEDTQLRTFQNKL